MSSIPEDQAGLQKRDAMAWDLAKNSVVMLLSNGFPAGQAAQIDKSGLFIVHQALVTSPSVQAKAPDGRIVTLEAVATDRPTQLQLLKASDWPAGLGQPVRLRMPKAQGERTPVVIVLPSGPVRGQLVTSDRVGILNNDISRRMIPLGEIRFESNAQSVAGALVFDDEGQLVGILNATLTQAQDPLKVQRVPAPASLPQTLFGAQSRNFGPADQTVAYTVGSDVLRRVVAGFLSPNHKVMHPAIGVMCKDAPVPGALIQQIRPGTPAEKAGLQAGDIIVKMDDTPIRNQIDFARFIETKDVGDTISVTVARDGEIKTVKLVVSTISAVKANSAGDGLSVIAAGL